MWSRSGALALPTDCAGVPWVRFHEYLLRTLYMRCLFVEFVCKHLCVYSICIVPSRYFAALPPLRQPAPTRPGEEPRVNGSAMCHNTIQTAMRQAATPDMAFAVHGGTYNGQASLNLTFAMFMLGVCVCVCVCVRARARVCVCLALLALAPSPLILSYKSEKSLWRQGATGCRGSRLTGSVGPLATYG